MKKKINHTGIVRPIFFILLALIVIGSLGVTLYKKYTSNEQVSEAKMLQLLDETRANFANYKNSFAPEARIIKMDSILKVTPQTEVMELFKENHFKATILLDLGKPEESVRVLEKLIASPTYLNMPIKVQQRVQDDLAVAYLRVGEQTNCITNHSVDACILPIKNGGIHKVSVGSRGTIEIYKKLLAQNPDDLDARWLLNIAYMTLGEYPKNVPKEFLLEGLDAEDKIKVKPFEDIAPDLGLAINNQAGGIIIEDFDNDGYLDMVTSSWSLSENMHYFKNNGDGTFTDNSVKARVNKFKGGLNIMQTDYNNDGFKDIFVPRGGWVHGKFGEQPNSLLRNNGDGTFTDVTIEAGLLSFHPTQTATWNDFNNDGWLDVFIGNETEIGVNYHPCELYMNNKNGTFTEIAQKANCNFGAYVKGVTSGDYNNDGLTDLFLSTLSGRRVLYKNKGIVNGQPSFEDVTMQANLDKDNNRSFSTWFWDFDNDGWLDILVGDYTFEYDLSHYAAAEKLGKNGEFHGQPMLYKNNHDGTFTNITNAMGLNKTAFQMGANFGDIDNDGFLDIYLGTGNPSYKSLVPNKMFKNMGGKAFADVTASAKVGSLQKGHGVAFGDMDNDGDQDIYIEMGGAYFGDSYQSSFFRNQNQENKNNWISLNLEGVKANKAAIGSKIKVTFKENGKTRSVYRDVNSGGSFGASPIKQAIGIGEAQLIDEIEIKWNGSKVTQTFKNVVPNKFFKIKEGNNLLEEVKLKSFTFKNKAKHEIPTCDVKLTKI